MSEQADGIQIESASSTSITEAPQRRAPIATMAALAIVIAAAAGFFALSQSEDGEINEIAAGQADEAADTSADTDGATFEVADFVPVQFTDISSENSPGYGRVFTDDGLYFVLSSAPGRVVFDQNTTDEQYMEAYRQDTLYVYSEDSGWTVQDVGDRFIADLKVNDGVLYAVSTGSATEDIASFGTSVDQGQSWNWNQLDGLPEINSITMMLNDDQDPVFYASRWGYPDYDEVLTTARAEGFNVSDMNLRGFDSQGFSYIEIDEDDPCGLFKAQHLPEIASFADWRAQAPAEEHEMIDAEYETMISWMKEELAGTGCEWDDAWLTEYSDPEAIENIEWPEPVRVEWSDIGFEVPESWTPWSTVYTYDGENFVDQGVPFSTSDGLELGGSSVRDGRLTVSVWDPSAMRRFESEVGDGEEFDEAAYQEAMEEAETVWSTTDGIEWINEPRSYGDEGFYRDENYFEPRAGNQRFQISWEAYEEQWEAEEATDSATEGVAVPTTVGPPDEVSAADESTTTTAPANLGDGTETATETTTVPPTTIPTTTVRLDDAEDTTADEEAPMEELDYYEGEYYEQPNPDLQRSIAGGPWETVTLAELAPGIDVGDRVLQDVRGSSLGVFLMYGPTYGPDGPPEGGQVLIHSNNGVDWEMHEIDADHLNFYGSFTGNGEILAFANKWNYTDNGGGRQETKTLLITPAE